MALPKYILDAASFIGGNDIDLCTVHDLGVVPVEEEMARIICSVSDRPDRNGLIIQRRLRRRLWMSHRRRSWGSDNYTRPCM